MRSASTWAACWSCPTTARSAGVLDAPRRRARPRPLRASATTRRWRRWTGPRRTPRTSPTTSPASSPRSACRRPTAARRTTRSSTCCARRCGASRCPGSREAVRALADAGLRLAVTSNSDGTVEDHLARHEWVQVGDGPGVPVEVVTDSGRGRRRQARRARVPGDHRRARACPPTGSCTSATARSTTSTAPPPSACRRCTWTRSASATATTRTSRALAERAPPEVMRLWPASAALGTVDAHVHLMRAAGRGRPRIYARPSAGAFARCTRRRRGGSVLERRITHGEEANPRWTGHPQGHPARHHHQVRRPRRSRPSTTASSTASTPPRTSAAARPSAPTRAGHHRGNR